MAINKILVGTIGLGLCLLLVVCVHSAPQLFQDDQDESADEFPVELEVEEPMTPLTRTRRGSQLASFGHHHNAYAAHDRGSHGHGHGGRVGPVFTYVRTDHHGNYQFGVRHTTGGHGWGR